MNVVNKKNKTEYPSIYKNGEYLLKNPSWHVEHSKIKAQLVQRTLDRNCIIPNTFADVGCGAGAVLTELSNLYEASYFDGYDISPQANELNAARATSRIKFYQSNFLASGNYYDCVLLLDVFEHVEDYIVFLKNISSRADYFVFHIPLDVNIYMVLRNQLMTERKNVGHLHYFNKNTAIATLLDCGFEIVDLNYAEWFWILPQKGILRKARQYIYKIVFNLLPDFAVLLFGGCELIVLAR